MKKVKLAVLVLGIGSAGLFAFKGMDTGSIKGMVMPAEAASKVWAISGTDTLKAPVQNGLFEISNARAGTYRLIIEAKPPYKNQAKDNVKVEDGQPTNVGAIKMEQ